MPLTSDTAIKAAATPGLLPFLGYSVLAAFLLGIVAGGYAGYRWADGAAAITERRSLRLEVTAWERVAKDQRDQGAQALVDMRDAIGRLGNIAEEREQDEAKIRTWSDQLAASLDTLRAERPDLGTCTLGADFLRHWNEASAGPGAAVPAAQPAGDAGKRGGAVPDAAAGQRSGADQDPGRARQGGGAVLRLQQQAKPAGAGDRRVGSHGVELVLQSEQGRRHQGNGLLE
jgi:hypothetical protein